MEAVRAEVRTSQRRSAYFYLVMIATVVLAAGISVLVSVKLNEQSERKLCAVVITADDGYHQQPPGTTAGKTQAVNMARLRSELGCPPYKGAR